MEKNIITVSNPQIPFEVLMSALRMEPEDDTSHEVMELYIQAKEIAKPIAIYSPFYPELQNGAVLINGVKLEEPFVYEMLSGQNIVIPYVASCGCEIYEWSNSITDFFHQFVADAIKQICLDIIRDKLFNEVKEKYFSGENISAINPGSLKQWPLKGQKPLFNILGGVTDDIGVVLTNSLLMSPNKSVSGIIFQTEQPFHNCQLCTRGDCPNRRAPYEGN